ncbi:extracellular solute-binding protein [Rugosimonospora africana]|nr:extracellular solute-binding protein [Rugosimonospora africana]
MRTPGRIRTAGRPRTAVPGRVRAVAAVALLSAALAVAGCGSSNPSSTGSAPTGGASAGSVPKGSGPVNVLYAGSLVDLMEKQIGPAFTTATGYKFTGFSAGSTALATQIKGKVHPGDVFISASPTVNTSLEGAANGNWVSWYATYASSPLVIGYNAGSKFAADLKSKPWYQVVTEPGFKLGTTDPATDPKGKLAAQAMTTAATSENLPALKAVAANKSTVFPEETLVGRLQSGQLDAGFFYSSEAVAANIPTVPVTGQDLKATYTVTVLNQAPDQAGAEAFVGYLLGPDGLKVLKQDGFNLVTPPTVTGSGVPASLSGVLSGQ